MFGEVFYFLSKLLVIFIRPLFWMTALPLWAFIAKNQKLKNRLLLITFILAFIFSNKMLMNEAALAWELDKPMPAFIPKTAVVLGGYCMDDKARGKVLLNDAQERLHKAIELYLSGKINKIIISGGTGSIFGKGVSEAIFSAKVAKRYGIPDTAIILEESSVNTFENARNTAAILKQQSLTGKVLLITSAFHMRRSLKCFHKQGIDAVPLSVHFLSRKSRNYNLADYLLPSSEALYRWDALIKEWIGYIAYRVSGKC